MSLFNTGDDDAELERLLSQAKEKLAAKQKDINSDRALAVPLRLGLDDDIRGSKFLNVNDQTGITKLDHKQMYKTDTKATASVSDMKFKERQDPTIKRKTRGEISKEKQESAGKQWFGMKAPVLTDQVKNDLRVLQLRNVLDPKRFYKKNISSSKKLPKYFETGTIIEGPTEFYSSRLTKKERRTNIVDELLADKQARDYFKRKVNEIHAHNNSGGKKWYKQNSNGRPSGPKYRNKRHSK